MHQVFLPSYTIGTDCFDCIEPVVSGYGKKVAIVYGEKAWQACQDRLLPKLANLDIVTSQVYGHEASWSNINRLAGDENIQKADFILAVGGGKCCDVGKAAAAILNKPVFTVATIASTCAPVTKISVIHNDDGSFAEIYRPKMPPVHCFIDVTAIISAPAKYFWAGMGDTMAKNVECEFKAKNDKLDFYGEYGKTISKLCFEPMLKDGAKAYQDVQNHVYTEEVEKIILSIIIATGSVSVSVNPKYNSAAAHALYYGLTVREWMERRHLHGEIVSYGTLVQLMIDQQWEKLKQTYLFNKSVGLPTCLADLELSADDPLDDVLQAAESNVELEGSPYKVTKEIYRKAIEQLETYNPDNNEDLLTA